MGSKHKIHDTSTIDTYTWVTKPVQGYNNQVIKLSDYNNANFMWNGSKFVVQDGQTQQIMHNGIVSPFINLPAGVETQIWTKKIDMALLQFSDILIVQINNLYNLVNLTNARTYNLRFGPNNSAADTLIKTITPAPSANIQGIFNGTRIQVEPVNSRCYDTIIGSPLSAIALLASPDVSNMYLSFWAIQSGVSAGRDVIVETAVNIG